MGKRVMYEQDYVSYWNDQGEYGRERVLRMKRRKQERYNRMKDKVRNGLRRVNGRIEQVCDYQPSPFHTSWCEYPCNGDC